MWWQWILFIICGILILGCNLATALEWYERKTGPFGPNPWSWWGCAIFTLVLAAPMVWLGGYIF